MTLVEILIGFAIALSIIVGVAIFAFRTPKIKGPNRHGIGGNGDYACQGSGGGGDGGGD